MEKLYLVTPHRTGTIAPEIYGVFTEHIGGCIYDGIYGENRMGEVTCHDTIHGFRREIIDRLRHLGTPVIRWPGGCFAEVYDWRDGIGPREDRPTRLNWWTQNDGKYEPNAVGTDEFLDFCALCGAQPYIAANLTAMTPLAIRDWIDYCNSPAGSTTYAKLRAKNGHPAPYNVKFWGVGNENWGGGGNMTPAYYAGEYRKYAAILDNACPGLTLFGCGANGGDLAWTRGVLDEITKRDVRMDGLAFHYYCGAAGDPVAFTNEEWDRLIRQAGEMEKLITRHWAAAVSYGMENHARLVIDEWGCWHPEGSGPSRGGNLFEQQSTIRDAVVTALTLNIFNNHCDKIRLCAVAQLVNNLHALFLAEGEKCICTPTYHVFDLFRTHKGASCIETIAPEGVSVSASVRDGKMTVTAANLSAERDVTLALTPLGCRMGSHAEIALLADADLHAHNTFAEPERVCPVCRTDDAFAGALDLPRGAVASVIWDMAE